MIPFASNTIRASMSRPPLNLILFALLLLLHVQVSGAGEPTGELAKFAKSRTWTDNTGKHKFEGQLKFASADEVQLTQTNGKAVKIPVDRLSEADQKFVNEFLKAEEQVKGAGEDNPFKVVGDADKMKPGNNAPSSTTSGENIATATDFQVRQSIVKGAKQIYAKMDKPFWAATPPLGFPEIKFDDMVAKTELSKPFFASMRVMSGGKAGISILSAYQHGRSEKEQYSRFAMVRAADGYSSDVLEIPASWKLAAISADGAKVAAIRDVGWGKGVDIGILRVTKTEIVPDYQFAAGGGGDEVHYVGFAGANKLVTISEKHNLVVWDLSVERPKAIFQGNSGGSLHAVLSPAGELMALPAGNSIAVIDIANAKVVGLIGRNNKASQISFSQDGRMLAAFEPFEIVLYNMADGKELRKVAVSEHQENAQLNWLGKYLMIGNVVYDVERGLPIWTYEGDPTSRTALGSYLICGFGGEKSSNLTLQKIPHESAIEASANIDPSTIYAIKPDDAVEVEYRFNSTPSDAQAAIRKTVEAKIEKLGWNLVNSARNSIIIEMEEGKPGTEDYYTRKGFGPFAPPPGFGRPSGPLEQVTYVPWTHKISISANGVQVYVATYTRGAPDNVSTKEGESTQAAVTRYCQPSPTYFEHLPIPPHMLKPEFKGGVGKSKLDANGLK
jgi:SLA1 homology domain 1, SHD1